MYYSKAGSLARGPRVLNPAKAKLTHFPNFIPAKK